MEVDARLNAKKISQALDEQLLRQKKIHEYTKKVLLLGTGESGKSTILKQMDIIHGEKYNTQQLFYFRKHIYSNIISSFISLSEASVSYIIQNGESYSFPNSTSQRTNTMTNNTYNINNYNTNITNKSVNITNTSRKISNEKVPEIMTSEESKMLVEKSEKLNEMMKKNAEFKVKDNKELLEIKKMLKLAKSDKYTKVKNLIYANPNSVIFPILSFLEADIARAIGKALKLDTVKYIMKNPPDNMDIDESVFYFYKEMINQKTLVRTRLLELDYLPTIKDILRARIRTVGINERIYKIKGNTFRMIDVGGQRSERKHWIHCFDDVTTVVYLVSLSDYYRVCKEDTKLNRTRESVVVFRSIVNSDWFKNASIVLFMNKVDIFKEKVKYHNIKDYFPEYDGDPLDVNAGIKFFTNLFTSQIKYEYNKSVYTYTTCATDTQQIKYILQSVLDAVLNTKLQDFGIM